MGEAFAYEVRQDVGVPKLIEPSGQSPEVKSVIKLIGSAAQTQILRVLSIEGALTTSEIATRLGVEHNRGAHRLLVPLREAGYVRSERIDTRGTIRWTVVSEQLPRAAQLWLSYVSGN